MKQAARAALIAAVFGVVFLEVNAGELRPSAVVTVVRVVAILALLVALKRVVDARRSATSGSGGPTLFGAGYWVVVVLELAALAVGLIMINSSWHPLDISGLRAHATPATHAWIAFVVGVHFLGLAALWRRPVTAALGLGIAACGAVGLLLASNGTSEATVAVVAGLLPGVLLLASSLSRRLTPA